MPQPLRLGLLFEYPSLNGGEHSLLAVLKQLGERIHGVALVPTGSPIEAALRDLSIETHAWDARSTTDIELARILATHPVEVWHANSLAMSRRLGRLAVDLQAPATGHLRDILKLSGRAIEDINHLRQIICVSHATRETHVRQGLTSDRSCVVYNGLDLERFRPGPSTGHLHAELGLPSDARLIVNVGQICLRKGQDTFIAVATELAKQDDSLHFLHCGARHSTKAESVAFDQQLDRTMQQAELSQRWHRLGIRTDLPLLLREVHLMLHCARQEPLGRVLLEALACGTPIVATHVGGTPEILRHREEGLIVEPDDTAAMVEAAQFLLSDAEVRNRMTEQGRQRCVEMFNVERAARETLSIWRSLRNAG